MRRAALAALALAAAVVAATPVAPAAAAVEVMVAGRDGRVLERAQTVATRARRVTVGARRCAVGGRTPLAALVATRARLRITDEGSCGRRTRDAGGLFVTSIDGQRNRGNDGWFYKVGRRAGTTGAGSPEGPFGTGRRVRDGQRVLWFYCQADEAGGCQRTLEVRPQAREVAAGGRLRVTVTGYDNEGRGRPAAGARVALGGATAQADAEGVATLTAPAAGGAALSATRDGAVPSFPERIAVR